MNKLLFFWRAIPRKVKYLTAGLLLAALNEKFPGVLPSLDPEWYVGGGAGLALLHAATDIAYSKVDQ